jgi:TFIIF-interacting CTD phosphatase-like protein
MVVDEDNTKPWDGVKTNKCICLDLDLTLVNTFANIKSLSKLGVYTNKGRHLRKRIYTIDLHDVVDTPGEGVHSRMWGAYRPGWQRFHDFSKQYFEHLIVWSAGQPKYVDAIIDVLFPDPSFQPIIVYNWNHCHSKDHNIYKPLKKIFADPRVKGKILPENTYVLDDRDDTFSLNKNNGILIPAYDIKPTEKWIMADDSRLLELEMWLSQHHVATVDDVRTLDKSSIFVE